MARDVINGLPDDPIEQAANMMRERRIGCLPVVEGGELVGIITSSDVMSALVYLVGANEPGSRMEISVPDRPGSLAGAAGVFGMCGINIVSAAMGPIREPRKRERSGNASSFSGWTPSTPPRRSDTSRRQATRSCGRPGLERQGRHSPRPGPGELRLRRRPSFRPPARAARTRALRGPRAAGRLPLRLPRTGDRRGPDDSPQPHLRAPGPEGRTGSGGPLRPAATTVSGPRTIPSSPICTRPAPAW